MQRLQLKFLRAQTAKTQNYKQIHWKKYKYIFVCVCVRWNVICICAYVCWFVIAIADGSKQLWSEAYVPLKEGNINKKTPISGTPLEQTLLSPPSLALSLSLFLHSFYLSLFFSLSPMLTFSTLSHIQTLPPFHVITASKDRRERETYTVLKRMLTLKKRRENVPNSLSLSFPHPPLPPFLPHILSLFFSCQRT